MYNSIWSRLYILAIGVSVIEIAIVIGIIWALWYYHFYLLDMQRIIFDMMQWAKVTENELCKKGEIATEFGENLSWEYLDFVRRNPIKWDIPTEILYADKDNLTSRMTVDNFVANHRANLTVMKDAEHWFHTEMQIAYLNEWMRKLFC